MGELNGKLKIKEFLMASPLDVKPFPIYWMIVGHAYSFDRRTSISLYMELFR